MLYLTKLKGGLARKCYLLSPRLFPCKVIPCLTVAVARPVLLVIVTCPSRPPARVGRVAPPLPMGVLEARPPPAVPGPVPSGVGVDIKAVKGRLPATVVAGVVLGPRLDGQTLSPHVEGVPVRGPPTDARATVVAVTLTTAPPPALPAATGSPDGLATRVTAT